MAKILIVDDDRNMRLLTSARLAPHYTVETADNGREALEIIHKGGIDLVVADIMMAYMDGYELLKTLRAEGYTMPVLLLTARDSMADKQKGFDLGTDDYMTKPFSSDELLWRIKALLRRANIAQSKRIDIGRVTLDSEKYALYDDSRYIEFSKKEFELLFKLLSYPEQIFSPDQLLDSIWGRFTDSGKETVKTHINRIRNKCADIEEFSIVTMKGLGYRAEIHVREI